MPRWTIPNISSSPKFGAPMFAACTLSLHTNFLPLCQVSLWLITRQSTLFLLVYTKMVRKSSSLMLLWCFWLSCSECRLRSFRLLFARKDLFDAGTSHAEDKIRTTRLCCRWFSVSRAHGHCTQTNLLDWNQLLFSVTKFFLLSSSTIAQVNVLERFLEIKC